MGLIIKGKPVADAISETLIEKVDNLKIQGIIPELVIVRVGAKASDLAYEKGILKRCDEVGIETCVKEFPENISQKEFIRELRNFNENRNVDAIMIFRPLPKQLDENIIKYVITPEKDIDCFNPINLAKVMTGDNTGFAPCTPCAVMAILKYYNIPIEGKLSVVIGRSMIVGKPMSMLLLNENSTVTTCHSKTVNLDKICSQADILVVGIGKAKFINSRYIKEEAVVIDVGINLDEYGKLCGDVDIKSCESKNVIVTPVPGGVGAVTSSILTQHIVRACKYHNNL
ncbi:bifunctional 5,10-methylenetetrahydrofolate dehydrogenase/5,10-methenyltetrahydrofolate cyclohydrolase [Clostridium sp. BJN0013]|uniref:bifunctional 5,10-methylenetetrahydrofolate dehydrogenase/5,10-methenyltetrahydrofolate cyclohydrolase n=1 Tax=Clostridium sp. BJN0013 TaxID=3236840 RepID=UPI0034C5BFD8